MEDFCSRCEVHYTIENPCDCFGRSIKPDPSKTDQICAEMKSEFKSLLKQAKMAHAKNSHSVRKKGEG